MKFRDCWNRIEEEFFVFFWGKFWGIFDFRALEVYEYRGSMLEDQSMFDMLFEEYPEGHMEVLEEGDEDEEDAERRLL